MKLINIKKGKREQVFEILDKNGWISDDETVKIFTEEGLWKVSEHIRIWKKLNADRDFFSGKNIIEKRKGHRCHLVKTDEMADGQYYKVGKEFFNEIKL